MLEITLGILVKGEGHDRKRLHLDKTGSANRQADRPVHSYLGSTLLTVHHVCAVSYDSERDFDVGVKLQQLRTLGL